MSRKSFLEQKRIGVLIRVFAQKEDDIPNRIELVEKLMNRLHYSNLMGAERIPFRAIDILVWADQRFDNSMTKPDCGKTAQALREHFSGQELVRIREVKSGDLFCGVLNYGVAFQTRDRIDYSLIVSPEAFPYITYETLMAVVDAAAAGALAVGVAIDELRESILEGRIANTFALWHNISLMTVGGFDCRAELPEDDRFAYYFRGWDGEPTNMVLSGVEEVRPLARMVQTFGACIAPVMPQGEVDSGYQIPDSQKQPELFERHVRKMRSKTERQSILLTDIGFNLSYLKGGVMPGYRLKQYRVNLVRNTYLNGQRQQGGPDGFEIFYARTPEEARELALNKNRPENKDTGGGWEFITGVSDVQEI